MLDLCAHPAPLFPVTHAYAPSDPLVQLGYWLVVLANAKLRRPASKVLPQFVQPVFHGNTPTLSVEFLDLVLEVRQCVIGPADFLARDREAKKAAFAHQCHLAFWQG